VSQSSHVLPARRLFETELRAGRPPFVTYTKAALELLGHPVGPPRPPVRRLSDVERRALGVTLRDALRLEVCGARFTAM